LNDRCDGSGQPCPLNAPQKPPTVFNCVFTGAEEQQEQQGHCDPDCHFPNGILTV